jgi:hypothetical protein
MPPTDRAGVRRAPAEKGPQVRLGMHPRERLEPAQVRRDGGAQQLLSRQWLERSKARGVARSRHPSTPSAGSPSTAMCGCSPGLRLALQGGPVAVRYSAHGREARVNPASWQRDREGRHTRRSTGTPSATGKGRVHSRGRHRGTGAARQPIPSLHDKDPRRLPDVPRRPRPSRSDVRRPRAGRPGSLPPTALTPPPPAPHRNPRRSAKSVAAHAARQSRMSRSAADPVAGGFGLCR